jgi:hypothetical protein
MPDQSRFAGIAAGSRLPKWTAGSSLTITMAALFLALKH